MSKNPENTELVRTCSQCGCTKPLDEFVKDSRKKYGVGYWCKVCKRNKNLATKWANIELYRERGRVADRKPERRANKKEWEKNNADKVCAAQRKHQNSEQRKQWYAKWVEENREKLNDNSKRWRERHPERARAATAKWESKHPESGRLKMHKRRARMANADRRIVLRRDVERLLRSDCAVCGSKNGIVIDHIIPISRGGRHAIGNLQPLCGFCNASKGAKTMVEWKFCRIAA